MMVFESKLSNNLVISFKGTQSISDIISDLNFIPIKCRITLDCGKVHLGFLKEYNDISDHLHRVMTSLDQPYNIYFTGHSLGGVLSVLATMEYTTRPKLDNIKSIHCITFGQPAPGDESFANFMNLYSKNYTYRRYVNINNHTDTFLYDPITTSYKHHPNEPLLLNCKKNQCPPFPIGLHFLDLYNGNIYNPHYASCNTNCKFYESNSRFYRYRYYHCPISSKSVVSGTFNPRGLLPDKYSVCLFTSKRQFLNYSYRNSQSCHLRNHEPNVPSIIVNQSKKPRSFRKDTSGEDLYIVVENHNTVLPTSSFVYNISFSNPILTPNSPFNLSCQVLTEHNDTMEIQVSFTSNNQHLASSATLITYNVYVSQVNKDWKKYVFTEPVLLRYINKRIKNIPKGIYSIVVTANNNSFESHTSNYFIIYHNNYYQHKENI
ncbi:hypothetical protein DICPUDRAFT_150433 [Dictyostelium purpureum]|uniref:Fungal lipase-type domain-containing protein n=1 Tax=Dictyostelium purpureum TaxID=5786 RepID=F0ZGB7_DICPU|nr:uncharacterized protein DICPUDRAFT_150433 [Dictyostelium purpureum]EGC37035.1 hypothetical protein DICPUDRAFT_150433 [Dictyostelium purpureum]|eukprot:XP_003286463.1 hypothetical protein DICPUDRAFT_150433 [Dictyostelium purpureum]